MSEVNIKIKRHRIEVHGYITGELYGPIEKQLVAWDYAFKRYDKEKKYFHYDKENKILVIPRTFGIKRLLSSLERGGIFVDEVIDETDIGVIPYDTLNLNMRGHYKARNQSQVDSIQFLSTSTSSDIHFKLLRLPTGEGKTFCALAAADLLDRKTLIITDTLVHQWTESVYDMFKVKGADVCIIRGSKSIEKLLKTRRPKFKFYIASTKTLHICAQNGILEKLLTHLQIGLKIIDECHKMTYSLFDIDISACVADTIYLTATPKRSGTSEDKIYQAAYYELPAFGQIVEDNLDKYHHFVYVMFNTRPTQFEISKCISRYGFNLVAYANHLFNSKNVGKMQTMIKDLLTKFLDNTEDNQKIVILFEKNDHITMMQKFLYSSMGIKCGIYSTLIKDINKKAVELDNRVILSTYRSIGTGNDIPNIRCFINTTTFSSEVTAKQSVGRLRRLPGYRVYYIDMCNVGFQNCLQHLKDRKQVFSKKAASEKTLDYTEF